MIAPLIAAGSLYCMTPKLKDDTATKWTETDQAALLEVQKEGCKKADPEQPCLYVFIKLGENEYTAVCGPMQKRKGE